VSSGQLFLSLADHRLGQSHINSQDTLPERPMSSESPTKPGLDEASTPAPAERPPLRHIFEGHERWISSFVFLHDNIHIVSGSEDGTMRKWDCETGLLVGEPWEGEGGRIFALALSPDGKTIACGRDDGSVQRWNTDGEMSEGVGMGHSDHVRSVSWSPNGGHIASGSDDGKILIRKAENGEVEMGPIETGQGWVYSLAYSPSGNRIASGGYETICIWDSNTGELLVGPIEDLGAYMTSVVWSSDSSKLYSASDKFVRVFDSDSGTELHRFEHNDDVNSVALSPKHNVLACVGDEGTAQLWDTESYQPLGKPFSPEDSVDLVCVSFSRDGRYLAYGGGDTKITLWMVADIAPELPVGASIGIYQGNNLHSRKFNLSPHHLSLKSVLSHLTSSFSSSQVLHRLMPRTLLRNLEVMT
jgi:WD40 repeat protein